MQNMQLYNTLSRKVEEFVPINEGKVGLYACGFTVYDYTHLGHLRKYSMDDVLVKTLRHAGYNVKFVQNVTDVGHLASDADTGEDKLEKGAKKYGKSVWDIAREFEDYFFKSMDAMGTVRPDVSCRATEHISEQLAMVLELEERGFTYVIDGDGVYFDTSKFSDYGKMARLQLDQQKEGTRIGENEGKRNPSDFALWKFEREGENRAMVWPSPWAERSFPGWHIECSAMACHYLGQQFDIHTGGIDHIPVHHTNEIAQAEAAFGKQPFVKYWVHHNFLRVEGEKMSKSLGNFFTIDDVVEKGFSPYALRLLFLTTHYRSELNFTWENLAGMQKAYDRIEKLVHRFGEGTSLDLSEKSDHVQHLHNKFWQAMENDLDTPKAVTILWEVVKDEKLTDAEKVALLLDFDQVFSLGLQESAAKEDDEDDSLDVPDEVQQLLKHRQQARDKKDWQKADQLRDEIESMGYTVVDGEDGQKVKKS